MFSGTLCVGLYPKFHTGTLICFRIHELWKNRVWRIWGSLKMHQPTAGQSIIYHFTVFNCPVLLLKSGITLSIIFKFLLVYNKQGK